MSNSVMNLRPTVGELYVPTAHLMSISKHGRFQNDVDVVAIATKPPGCGT